MADDVAQSMTVSEESHPQLSSAQKSLWLLEVLAETGCPLGVSDLARRVGGARGTIHKQLAGLVASGWVEQDPDGRYRLTLKAARIGHAALEQAGLGERIHALLTRLASRAGETVSIAALADDAAVIVQRAESGQVLHADIRVGTRVALDDGASGLVIAAFALDAAARDELRERGVPIASELTLAQIVAEGCARTVDRLAAGITAVSIPLHDPLNFQTMALTIAGPSERLDMERAEALLRDGRELIADAISGDSAARADRGRAALAVHAR